jgi:hypothetical protein
MTIHPIPLENETHLRLALPFALQKRSQASDQVNCGEG